MTGLPAWVLWRGLMLAYLPSWDRRLRVMADWFLAPFVGRDIVSLNLDEQLAIERTLFEPGQDVVQQGDVGQSMYIIRSGEAEVVRKQEDREQVLGVLTPGAHFGEVAVFQRIRRTATVRARTRLELLEIRREAANVLSDSLPALGKAIRETPHAESLPADAESVPAEGDLPAAP
jgi:CRP-like cAMP-binding protein